MADIFILQAFSVFTVVVVMVIVAIQNLTTRRFQSICLLAIMGMTVALTGLLIGEYYAKFDIDHPFLATFITFAGYAIRPFCLYTFLLMSKKEMKRIDYLLMIPLALNALIYASSLFLNVPFLKELTFYYPLAKSGDVLEHTRGPLNFTSHILSALYLVYLLYQSMKMLRGKHRADGYSIIICAAFIVAAVIIEMNGLAMGVLNITIATSCVFYYLFLLREENRRDPLTGLFDRKSFYRDCEKFGKSIVGAIQIDMNGLKAINDIQGHEAGDKALKDIAGAISDGCKKYMYLYRVGGDEFTVLVLTEEKAAVDETIANIKKSIEKKGYSCSFGFCYRGNEKIAIHDMLRMADEAMYEDKATFYKEHPNCNRRVNR